MFKSTLNTELTIPPHNSLLAKFESEALTLEHSLRQAEV